MAVRARRVIGPIIATGGTTVLDTPSVGQRWKTEWFYLFQPGALAADVELQIGPTSITRLGVWKASVGAGASVALPYELAVDAGDSWAVVVSALDVVYFTVQAFELTLP